MGSLLFLVLCAAALLMFSDETLDFIKKILRIKGMHLLLPLSLLSWLVNDYELYIQLCLLFAHEALRLFILNCVAILPFKFIASELVVLLLLFCLSTIPVMVFYWIGRRQGFERTMYWSIRAYPMSWIFWMMLIMA